jgi:hypothetical protein
MFIEDYSAFLADFAVPCTVAGQAVRAIFDNDFALGSAGIGMAGTQPVLTLPTNLLAQDPVGQYVLMMDESDPSLSLSFTTGEYQMPTSYLVAAHEPDGTGMSRLLLERA